MSRHEGWIMITIFVPVLTFTICCPAGLVDASVDDTSPHSVFPANTNVLYVGLEVRDAGCLNTEPEKTWRPLRCGLADSTPHWPLVCAGG